MSIDSSLKTSGGLTRHRNVLSRAERIEKLTEKGAFDSAESDPLGLPKVGNRKLATGKKTTKKAAATEEAESAG